jgi:hypothetical protein
MTARKTNKIGEIKKHLLRGLPLTSFQCFALYGYTRLAAGVHKLKAQGWDINTTEKQAKDGVRYAEYRLAKKPQIKTAS